MANEKCPFCKSDEIGFDEQTEDYYCIGCGSVWHWGIAPLRDMEQAAEILSVYVAELQVVTEWLSRLWLGMVAQREIAKVEVSILRRADVALRARLDDDALALSFGSGSCVCRNAPDVCARCRIVDNVITHYRTALRGEEVKDE